jgi:hypothetical protein
MDAETTLTMPAHCHFLKNGGADTKYGSQVPWQSWITVATRERNPADDIAR